MEAYVSGQINIIVKYIRVRCQPVIYTFEDHTVEVSVGTKGDYQDEFLHGDRPKDLLTDGLQQYHMLEGLLSLTISNCWSHAQQDFADAIKAINKTNPNAIKRSLATRLRRGQKPSLSWRNTVRTFCRRTPEAEKENLFPTRE